MKRARIVLTGANGQVGWALRRTLSSLGEVLAHDSTTLDIADRDALRGRLRALEPAIIVNAAAYTAVDRAESDADRADAVNAVAPRVMAEEAARTGALLLHFSTDYVFSGEGQRPWQESDRCEPLNVYGRSKLAGELAIAASGCRHLIFRTSWVYGARGSNFLLTMRRLMRERPELRIVADQIGAPTWCRDLAEASAQIIAQWVSPRCAAAADEPWGVYHLCNAGETSWHGFATAIQALDVAHGRASDARLLPIPSSEYPTPARRPLNSRLDCDRLERTFGVRLQHWERALELCMDEMTNVE